MGVVILVLVVIAALFAVVSGVWVAIALITAISAHRDMPGLRRTQSSRTQCRTDEPSSDKDI